MDIKKDNNQCYSLCDVGLKCVITCYLFVSVIGFGLKNNPCLFSTIFSLLNANNIKILMMLSSEIKISIMVPEDQTELVLKIIHEALVI